MWPISRCSPSYQQPMNPAPNPPSGCVRTTPAAAVRAAAVGCRDVLCWERGLRAPQSTTKQLERGGKRVVLWDLGCLGGNRSAALEFYLNME